MRARITLKSAEELSGQQVADMLHTTRATVGKWRCRFLEDGCDGLLDERRPHSGDIAGRRDAVEPRVDGDGCGLSASTACRVWRAFGLKPHRNETLKLSKDP